MRGGEGKRGRKKGRVGKRDNSNVNDVVTRACNLALGRLSKGASRVQGHPKLCSKFQVYLSNSVGLYFKLKKKRESRYKNAGGLFCLHCIQKR